MDKRSQTLGCPHCDRTFQQIQRYREHIAKKHAEEVQESNDAASNSNQAGDASTGPSQVLPKCCIAWSGLGEMDVQAKQTVHPEALIVKNLQELENS